MKNFRWILVAGLLATVPQLAHAQAPQPPAGDPGSAGVSATGAGSVNNAPDTTVTTETTISAPTTDFVPVDDAAMGTEITSTMPDTGGEPMIAVLAGLTVACAAFAMRRKMTA